MRPAQEGDPGKVGHCGHEKSLKLQSPFDMCAHLGLGWSALSQLLRAAILIFQSWERSLADSSRLGAQTGRISTVCSASSSDMSSLAARPVVIFSRQRQIACH